MDGAKDEERIERFRPREDATATRLAKLKTLHAQKRETYMAEGVLPDPARPDHLQNATKLVGTCMDMCPEYERLEREVQKELDRFEMAPGTTTADPRLAVKIYRRPAAGRELPLPEDVRPPAVLQRTLDYLISELLPSDPRDTHFAAVQPFMWNRTRAIRQDFIVQGDRGSIAIACHERIARYHILCLHWKGGEGAEAWSEQQELEQLRKTLRSLMEYYDDQRAVGQTYENEPEFRAYNLLLHARDPEALREVELLPTPVFLAEPLQWALEFRSCIQRSNLLEKRGTPGNTEATPNFFTRAFRSVALPQVSYLMACLAENLFTGIRIGAIKALARAYLPQHHGLPIKFLTRILGMDCDADTTRLLRMLNVEVYEAEAVAKVNRALVLDEDKSFASPFSHTLVETKRGMATCQAIIDGKQALSQPPQPPPVQLPSANLNNLHSFASTSAAPPPKAAVTLGAGTPTSLSMFSMPTPKGATVAAGASPSISDGPKPLFSTTSFPWVTTPQRRVFPPTSTPAPSLTFTSPSMPTMNAPPAAPTPEQAMSSSAVLPSSTRPDSDIRVPSIPTSGGAPPEQRHASASIPHEPHKSTSLSPQPRPAPPKPRRAVLPQAQLIERLTKSACDKAMRAAVREVAHSALTAEYTRRRQLMRASLLDTVSTRLWQRLQAQPVASQLRAASMDAVARVHRERTMLHTAWIHWRAIYAKVIERKSHAQRLMYLRSQLPQRVREPSAIEGSMTSSTYAQRLSDTERQAAFSKALDRSSRLWECGSMSSAIVERVEWLCDESHECPASWTAAIYARSGSASSRWLRHKLALDHHAQNEYVLQNGRTVVRILDGHLVHVHSPQLVMANGFDQVPSATEPGAALIVIAWTQVEAQAIRRTCKSASWTSMQVLVLDQPQISPDALLVQALETAIPSLVTTMEQEPVLRTAIQPFWDAWLETCEAMEELLRHTSTSCELAYDAFCALTSLANALLCSIQADAIQGESSYLPYPPRHMGTSVSDTLLMLAIRQLDMLVWIDTGALALLRARVMEHTTSGVFHVARYMQALMSVALTWTWDASAHTPKARADDVARFQQMSSDALTYVASRLPTSTYPRQLESPDAHTSLKRPLTPPPTHVSKRIRDDEPSIRLRQLLAQSATLLRTPSE